MATMPMRHATKRLFDENRMLDWILVALGIWLFISPWVLSFAAEAAAHNAGGVHAASHAAWNAWVIGAILFFVMLSAVGRLEASQEWMALVLGAWTFAAPWALGFVPLARASWDHWGVGAVVFLIAAWNIWRLRRVPPGPASPVGSPRPTSRQPLV
jgi:SPW repeat